MLFLIFQGNAVDKRLQRVRTAFGDDCPQPRWGCSRRRCSWWQHDEFAQDDSHEVVELDFGCGDAGFEALV